VDEGEADLPLVDVDADDPDLDLLTRLEDVLRLGLTVVGELRDVEQALEVVVELHEDPEVGDLGDEAGEQVADVVVARDLLEPRVRRQLLAAQGDALLLHVDGEHDALHLVALLDHLGGVADLLRPRHVGDVQQAVDALLDLDEGAVAREVPDGALDDGADRVVLLDHVPGVHLRLLHAEGDLLLGVVELEHHDLDRVPGLDELARVVHAAGPGHLGDVHQALDPLLELHEGAVGHDVHDLALVLAADRVARLDAVPRGRGLLLETQRDALAVEVDAEDLHLELLLELDHLRGVVDPAPGHVGDVQEAVDAAEVHEHAEVGDVLDRTHADLALGDVLEQRLLLLLALLFEQLPAGDDDVHALRVDLDDARAHRLVDEVGDVVGAAQRDLAGREEDVDALDVHEQAALDLALDDALDLVALLVLLGDVLPGAEAIGAALREHRHVVLVEALEVDLEDLAARGQLVTELVQRDLALGLPADVHDHEPGALVDRVHLRVDDLAGDDVDDGLVEALREVFEGLRPEGLGDSLLQLGRVELVLADAARCDGHGMNVL